MNLDLQHEPVRLPAVVVAVLLLVGPVAIAALLGADIREAVATALGGLIASGGVIGAAESVRARTDSPATIADRADPGDEWYPGEDPSNYGKTR